jgi:CubicO group peptidase (beta-lactamase class C family)
MTPKDMAGFGLMVLNGGVWGKERIVSERWVEESTRCHATTQFGGGYGYLWWAGADGSRIPALQAVQRAKGEPDAEEGLARW